ncbi:AmmeMemoRadiSam system protein B [Dehalobacter sp. DCM]|uniref:AmmeMemoRadiSam system protein B n=1 Tax=Dehalobacter sp. DCM TaxID=2907827 RepID=UPI003081FF8C|nr:AmmeMemoRadiSam system protein B [Dehalobacter sp. DCM]
MIPSNNKKREPAFSLTYVVLLVLFSGMIVLSLTGCDQRDSVNSVQEPTHPSFITNSEWRAVLASVSESSSPFSANPAINGRIVSAVIPHHLTAARLISDVLQLLAPQKPDVIILIGPNHTNKGNPIITGTYGWQTPEGVVQTDPGIVDLLLSQHLAVKDEETLSTEHAIGSLVPLIRHYLPDTRIVPIILHHGVSRQEVEALLDVLQPVLTERSVLMASVDFSHYLTRNEAQLKDQETLTYMKQFNYPALFRLNSDYLDSPASLTAAFLLAQKQGINTFTLLENTNSGIIMQNDTMETTSYFTMVFTE